MPELPEVETIIRYLNKDSLGLPITSVACYLDRIYQGSVASTDLSLIFKGKSIEFIKRRGKYIIIIFRKTPNILIVHLGMSGQLILNRFPNVGSPLTNDNTLNTITGLKIFKPNSIASLDRHCHFIIRFKKGNLVFRDPRTFGKIILSDKINWEKHPRIKKLGLEPLATSMAKIYSHWPKKSARPIKTLLLDQSILAGVGNIYADEALFRAGINPQAKGNNLTEREVKALIRAVKYVLKKGIKNFGTTFSNFIHPSGTTGRNYKYLRVYGRGGLPCAKCQSILLKLTLAGRGSVFCPECQKLGLP